MARITWLGEDELHKTVSSQGEIIEGAGPDFTVWHGIKFPKGDAVDVTNAQIIAKAKINSFFKVEGTPGRPRKVSDDDKNAE